VIITATEFKNKVGNYLRKAQQKDIIITKNGRFAARLTTSGKNGHPLTESLIGVFEKAAAYDTATIKEERLKKEGKSMGSKELSWKTLIGKALLLFLLLVGSEIFFAIISFSIESDVRDIRFGASTQNMLFNRFMVVLCWAVLTTVFYKWSKNKDIFNKLFWKNISLKRLLLIGVIVVAFHAGFNYFYFERLLPQIIIEHSRFITSHGNIFGNIGFLLQLFYYFFESTLVLFMLAFFQLAGEIKFKKEFVPWGGLGLALTWGVGHFLNGLESGFLAIALSLVIGIVYLAGKKAFVPVFLMTFLLFMI